MRLCITLLGLILGAGAQALESLSKQELLALCGSGKKAEVDVCNAYVRGFLDGAFATDPRVVDNVLKEMEEESFSERATRTRLGITLERFGPSYYAGLCIPADVTLQSVRMALEGAAETETAANVDQSAADYLYQSLQNEYPCSNTP